MVSGFLGAGKTTFIRALARHLPGKVCILENEFGASSIDQTVLRNEGVLDVWEMTEGCICCSSRDGLVGTVLSIASVVEPDHLIIEVTGVGMLSEILSTLKQIDQGRLRLLPPVCVVDGAHIEANLRRFGGTLLDQVRAAGTLVVSKGEHLTHADRTALATVLQRENPAAEIIGDAYAERAPGWWRPLLHSLAPPNRFYVATDGPSWESVSLKGVALPSPSHLLGLLGEVVQGRFGDVARAKGMLPCGPAWVHFELAGPRYEICGYAAQPESNVVFIGLRLDRTAIEAVLAPAPMMAANGPAETE